MSIVQVAQDIADEVLFPAALATEASDVVPRELLDTLAAAGLYGLPAPGSSAAWTPTSAPSARSWRRWPAAA